MMMFVHTAVRINKIQIVAGWTMGIGQKQGSGSSRAVPTCCGYGCFTSLTTTRTKPHYPYFYSSTVVQQGIKIRRSIIIVSAICYLLFVISFCPALQAPQEGHKITAVPLTESSAHITICLTYGTTRKDDYYCLYIKYVAQGLQDLTTAHGPTTLPTHTSTSANGQQTVKANVRQLKSKLQSYSTTV